MLAYYGPAVASALYLCAWMIIYKRRANREDALTEAQFVAIVVVTLLSWYTIAGCVQALAFAETLRTCTCFAAVEGLPASFMSIGLPLILIAVSITALGVGMRTASNPSRVPH